jgi:hypothetical protein
VRKEKEKITFSILCKAARRLAVTVWLQFNAAKVLNYFAESGVMPDACEDPDTLMYTSDEDLRCVLNFFFATNDTVTIAGSIHSGIFGKLPSIEFEYLIPIEQIFSYKKYAMFRRLSQQ